MTRDCIHDVERPGDSASIQAIVFSLNVRAVDRPETNSRREKSFITRHSRQIDFANDVMTPVDKSPFHDFPAF
jgi:hypothetical protein